MFAICYLADGSAGTNPFSPRKRFRVARGFVVIYTKLSAYLPPNWAGGSRGFPRGGLLLFKTNSWEGFEKRRFRLLFVIQFKTNFGEKTKIEDVNVILNGVIQYIEGDSVVMSSILTTYSDGLIEKIKTKINLTF